MYTHCSLPITNYTFLCSACPLPSSCERMPMMRSPAASSNKTSSKLVLFLRLSFSMLLPVVNVTFPLLLYTRIPYNKESNFLISISTLCISLYGGSGLLTHLLSSHFLESVLVVSPFLNTNRNHKSQPSHTWMWVSSFWKEGCWGVMMFYSYSSSSLGY